MIIQLLGANGAGKSTVVVNLMGLRSRLPLHVWGRRVPDGYALTDLVVVGHYEGQVCGGGDTLPRHRVADTVRRLDEVAAGRAVLLEGPTGREPALAGDVRGVSLRKQVDRCTGH